MARPTAANHEASAIGGEVEADHVMLIRGSREALSPAAVQGENPESTERIADIGPPAERVTDTAVEILDAVRWNEGRGRGRQVPYDVPAAATGDEDPSLEAKRH